jgi:hypothetical protein
MEQQNWVEFDPYSYSLLKKQGMRYFALIGGNMIDATLSLYPFKTKQEAHDFMKNNNHPENENNYVLKAGRILQSLANDVDAMDAKVMMS